jgi:exopolysaccharide biosynthesis polyprenyl glycosylphosphotransferase
MNIRYSKLLPLITFVGDLVLLNIALQCAHLCLNDTVYAGGQSTTFIVLFNMAWVTVASLTKNFIVHRPLVLSENVNVILSSFIYHLLMVIGFIYFLNIKDVSRLEIVVTYVLFFCSILLERAWLFYFLDYLRKKGYNRKHILLVGNKAVADKLIKSFARHPEYGYHFTDFIPNDVIESLSEESLVARIFADKPDEIFVCYTTMSAPLLQQIVDLGEESSIKVKFVPDLFMANNYASVVNYGSLPVFQLTANPPITMKLSLFKRSFDILFSILVMIPGLPIFVALIIITKLTSKGDVFYRQERIGKGNKPFYIYKFRSMFSNAESFGPQLSKDNDPRITKWGRFIRKSRLDELPQFWNVLKGDMSVVGPRPERQFFIEQLTQQSKNYKRLLYLKPGLTSMGQVNYGYAENIEQMRHRVRYDLIYLKNISFKSDMGIILKTVQVMIQLKGK